MILNFIWWDVSPEILKLGPFSLRWYGLLFASGFVLGYLILTKLYAIEKKPQADLEQLSIYVILGTVIGARLGHCLFYDPSYYLSHLIEILKVWQGGLASHGAAIGIVTSIYLITKKQKDKTMLWILDRVVIVVALAAVLIRLGNLFNSEIIGKATDVPWAFIFARVDDVPRHPAQLYESFFYLITFVVLYFTYMKTSKKSKQGFLFGLAIAMIFGFRFFVEFVKENQSAFEQGLILNMGQMLSIPFLLAGLYSMFRKQKEITKKKK